MQGTLGLRGRLGGPFGASRSCLRAPKPFYLKEIQRQARDSGSLADRFEFKEGIRRKLLRGLTLFLQLRTVGVRLPLR
jgi:hypothetical protein